MAGAAECDGGDDGDPVTPAVLTSQGLWRPRRGTERKDSPKCLQTMCTACGGASCPQCMRRSLPTSPPVTSPLVQIPALSFGAVWPWGSWSVSEFQRAREERVKKVLAAGQQGSCPQPGPSHQGHCTWHLWGPAAFRMGGGSSCQPVPRWEKICNSTLCSLSEPCDLAKLLGKPPAGVQCPGPSLPAPEGMKGATGNIFLPGLGGGCEEVASIPRAGSWRSRTTPVAPPGSPQRTRATWIHLGHG